MTQNPVDLGEVLATVSRLYTDNRERNTLLDEVHDALISQFSPVMSRFERIQQYSLEEFAEWLSSNIDCQYCLLGNCAARNAEECQKIFEAWLRSPYIRGGPGNE